MKKCRTCEEVKELTDFPRHRRAPDGRSNLCKVCDKERASAYRAANSARVKESNRKNYVNNKDAQPSRSKASASKYTADWYVEDRYLTIEVYEQDYDGPPVILDQHGVPFPPSYTKPALGFDPAR